MYENPWYIAGKPFTEEMIGKHIGFVYLITDTITGKLYVGKKIFHNRKARKPLKGKTKRRISHVQSDWQDYYGSNDELKKLVETNDRTLYAREILHLCNSKSEMSYKETKELFERDALLSDKYYNQWITCKITRKQLNGLQRSTK